MRTRSTLALATGVLLAAMLPGVAMAGNGPQKDHVTGTATFDVPGGSRAWVSAHSDADGSNPRGRYRLVEGDIVFTARVVCLYVDGDEAVVGLVVTSSRTALAPVGTELLHYIVDAGSPGTADASTTFPGLTAADCATTPAPGAINPITSGNWIVKDN